MRPILGSCFVIALVLIAVHGFSQAAEPVHEVSLVGCLVACGPQGAGCNPDGGPCSYTWSCGLPAYNCKQYCGLNPC